MDVKLFDQHDDGKELPWVCHYIKINRGDIFYRLHLVNPLHIHLRVEIFLITTIRIIQNLHATKAVQLIS